MARQEMLYIELKTGMNDRGPAWIGLVTLSRSRRTIYFDGKALKRVGGRGISGNHCDFETGDEYWISGVKKDGSDRHWAGGGLVMVDSRIVEDCLTFRGLSGLDPQFYKIVSVKETDISLFHSMENEPL